MGNQFIHAGPSEALIVSTLYSTVPEVIIGGVKWRSPLFQKYQIVSLEILSLIIHTPKVYTSLGVPLNVTGVASIKVKSETAAILIAAEQFIEKDPSEIEQIFLLTIEGHQRAIMSTMTVEEIYHDREKFAHEVKETAQMDLDKMGIEIVSYVLKDVHDDRGYLLALDLRTPKVKRDAEIQKAVQDADQNIKIAHTERDKQIAKYKNETAITVSASTFAIRKNQFDAEVSTKKAESDLAYELQTAKARQRIMREQMEIQVIERRKQIEIQQKTVDLKQLQLESKVIKPATAEKDKIEIIASATKQKMIKDSEGQSQLIITRNLGEPIQLTGSAQADVMNLKANSWKQYNEAAMVSHIIDVLPSLATAISRPLAKTKEITIVNEDGDIQGSSRFTNDISVIIGQLPVVFESFTGVNISGVIKSAQLVSGNINVKK